MLWIRICMSQVCDCVTWCDMLVTYIGIVHHQSYDSDLEKTVTFKLLCGSKVTVMVITDQLLSLLASSFLPSTISF